MNNKELEEYYDNFLDLFNHKGWKQLLEDLGSTAKNLNDVATIRDERDLDFRQGQLTTITTLLNFPESVRQTIDSIEAEEDADDL